MSEALSRFVGKGRTRGLATRLRRSGPAEGGNVPCHAHAVPFAEKLCKVNGFHGEDLPRKFWKLEIPRPFHAGDPWRLPFSPAGGLPNRLAAISVAIAGVAGTRDIGGGTRAA